MTWGKNLRALLLALVAVGVVAALVLVLVQSVRADRGWKRFVERTTSVAEEAAERIDGASELASIGAKVGVGDDILLPLEEQISESEALLAELSTLSDYILEDERHGMAGTHEPESSPQSELAGLDLYAELDAGGVSLITPDSSHQIIEHYREISRSLEASVEQLEPLGDDVKAAVDEHLGEIGAAVSLSREALTSQLIRGQIVVDYALRNDVAEADVKPLQNALAAGQDALVAHRVVDRDDAAAMSKALTEMDDATAAINRAAVTLVEILGVDAEELLAELDPQEFWEDEFEIDATTTYGEGETEVEVVTPTEPETTVPPTTTEPTTPPETTEPPTTPEQGGGETDPGEGGGENSGGEGGTETEGTTGDVDPAGALVGDGA